MPELTLERYNDLVGLVYQAGADPELWPLFINELDTVLDGVHLSIYGHDMRNGLSLGTITSRYSDQYMHDYETYFANSNLFLPVLMQAPVMEIRYSEDWVAKEDLLNSEFFNDWLAPQGDLGSGGGGVLSNEDERLLIISGQVRFRDEDEKTPLLINTLRLLAPHIRRAFAMQRTLQGQQIQLRGYQQALDRVRNSVFLLDARGAVSFANKAGLDMLKQYSSVRRDKKGILGFHDIGATRALQLALHSLTDPNHPQQPVSFPVTLKNGLKVAATLDPFNPKFQTLGPFVPTADPAAAVAVLVLANRAIDSPVAAHLLRELYGLTPAEQMVTMRVSQGQSLSDMAKETGLSVHTLRTQLKAAYAKTGTRRQSQLAGLVHQLNV